MSKHIALLGDSIFDNASYTGGAPDVVTHLRGLLPGDWRATLFAIDGSVASQLPEQLGKLPDDVSQLVISTGGNDALMHSDLLGMPVASTAEALSLFATRIAPFETEYRSAITDALALDRPTTLCTIYNGNLDPPEASIARIALMMFNDVILRTAFEFRLPTIDLRFVCDLPEHYANPIEPSDQGGRKIAEAIANACGVDEVSGGARVFVQ